MLRFLRWLSRLFVTPTTAVTGHDEPPIIIDAEGWLHGENVERFPSVREYALTTRDQDKEPVPTGICWHFTATGIGTARSMAKRIAKYRRGKDRAASWHIVIADDGTVYQSVSVERGAWHCKVGRHKGHRINRSCIGIELEGYGREFSTAQIESARHVLLAIATTYGLSAEDCALDHSQFDPGNRNDAGPVWSAIRTQLIAELGL